MVDSVGIMHPGKYIVVLEFDSNSKVERERLKRLEEGRAFFVVVIVITESSLMLLFCRSLPRHVQANHADKL